MEDIKLISTEKLVDEFLSRFDAAVVHGVKVADKKNIISFRRLKGSTYTCIGLCHELSTEMALNLISFIGDLPNHLK